MKKLEEITLNDFKEAINFSISGGHNSVAPLGMSGDTIRLHCLGEKKDNGCIDRVQQVSIRLYSGNPELLITNNSESFLFYGRYDIRLGGEFVAKEYYRIFKLLEHKIPLDSDEDVKLKVTEDAHHTIGFDMLAAFKQKESDNAE